MAGDSGDSDYEWVREQDRRSRFGRWSGDLVQSLVFLTVLPLGRAVPLRPLSEAMGAFPLAGALIGLLQAIVFFFGAYLFWPLPVAVLLALLTGVIVTGALHEDGLADTADALGGRTREQSLAIMRDSRIGTYGVLALFFSFGLRFLAVYQFAAVLPFGATCLTLVAVAAATRAAPVLLLHALVTLRSEGRSAEAGRPNETTTLVALASAALIGAIALYWGFGVGGALCGFVGIVAGYGMMHLIAARRFGGQTGDIAGAAQQTSEAGLLLGLLVGL